MNATAQCSATLNPSNEDERCVLAARHEGLHVSKHARWTTNFVLPEVFGMFAPITQRDALKPQEGPREPQVTREPLHEWPDESGRTAWRVFESPGGLRVEQRRRWDIDEELSWTPAFEYPAFYVAALREILRLAALLRPLQP